MLIWLTCRSIGEKIVSANSSPRVRPYLPLFAIWLSIATTVALRADDQKVNTNVVTASLLGKWELQPPVEDDYRQTLNLGTRFTGEWQRNRATLPVSIAWFVEGGELRVLYYYEPAGAFNYRVKTVMIPYRLLDDTLTLTFDGKPSSWRRIREAGETDSKLRQP